MRPLEWALVISFLPILVLTLARQHRRRWWLLAAACLPIFASLLQARAEGWRPQIAPLYLLAVVVLLWHMAPLAGRGDTVGRRHRVLPVVVIAAILIPTVVLAGWLLPIVELPEPTGPYAVGVVDRELFDETRRRRLMATVWYPAMERGSPAPLTRHPEELQTALANLTSLPALLFQHLRYVTLAASDGAPMLPGTAPYPILVFSHGLVGMRLQSSSTLQELASWGYVVIALDHTDAAAMTVFPDGEARYYDAERFGIPAGLEPSKDDVTERMFPVWVADQRFVYDILETWARADPMFAGKIDPRSIGSFGHSFGGAAALEVCLVEPRCRAAADMDGGLYGASESAVPIRPILLVSSADSRLDPEAQSSWGALIERAGVGYWLELSNSSHLSFTFSQLLSPLLSPPGYDPRAGLRAVDAHLRAFFAAHLRNGDAAPNWPAESSEIIWLEGK